MYLTAFKLIFPFIGYIFPALVAALVPIRSYLVAWYFKDEDLKYLDPIGETEEEAHDERATYLERRPSVDEADLQQPGFSDFHAAGMQHDLAARSRSSDALDDNQDTGNVESQSTLTRRHKTANE